VGPQTWFGFGPKVGLSGEGPSIRELLVYDNVYGGSANTNDLIANLHRTSGKTSPRVTGGSISLRTPCKR